MKQRWLCYDDYWSKEKVNVYSIDNRDVYVPAQRESKLLL